MSPSLLNRFTILAVFLVFNATVQARPFSPATFDDLTEQSSSIILAELLGMNVVAKGEAVVQKYALGAQKAFKGGTLPASIELSFGSEDESDCPIGFKLPPSLVGHQYILLFLKQDMRGKLSFTSGDPRQRYIFVYLDQPIGNFTDLPSLIKYLLSSQKTQMDGKLATTNFYAGLAVSKDIHDINIRTMLQKIAKEGSQRDQFYALRDLTPRAINPDGVLRHLPAEQQKIVDAGLALWEARWNAGDIKGLISMLERGAPPYTGEKSDANLTAKLTEDLKNGPINNLQILQLASNGTSAVLHIQYVSNGKERKGGIDIDFSQKEAPKVLNISFEK